LEKVKSRMMRGKELGGGRKKEESFREIKG